MKLLRALESEAVFTILMLDLSYNMITNEWKHMGITFDDSFLPLHKKAVIDGAMETFRENARLKPGSRHWTLAWLRKRLSKAFDRQLNLHNYYRR